MARYFFDINDGSGAKRDDQGLEFDDLADVRKAAISALPDVARDELPDGDQHVMSVRVRDRDGHYLFHATLSLVAEWMEKPAKPDS